MRKAALSRLFLLIIFGMVMLTMTACSSRHYETNTYEVNERFSSISVKTDTADLVLVASDDEKCKVVCYEEEKQSHSVQVQNGTLTITLVNDKEWYDYIGIHIGTPKITIYLPEEEYSLLVIEESTGDIEIANDFKFESMDLSLSTGDVCVENILVGSLDITTSTGKVTVSDVTCEGNIKVGVSTGKTDLTNVVCKNLTSTGSTGDVSLKNVIVTEKLSIERNTGDVKFDGSDAAEIFVTTDTGDVEGSLLTNKVFIAKTDTGRIHVPNSTTGGRCEITTDTGDIKISILES